MRFANQTHPGIFNTVVALRRAPTRQSGRIGGAAVASLNSARLTVGVSVSGCLRAFIDSEIEHLSA